MPNAYWHAPGTIEQLNHLERPGFAIEFLRRNLAYRRDYARVRRQIARDRLEAETALANLARRWGLRFRA